MTTAIVLAGGSGKRYGGEIKKQYIEIKGAPIIVRSLLAFEKSSADEIIIVCSPEDVDYCREAIVNRFGLTKVKKIVSGGAERYDSVYNGLLAAAEGKSGKGDHVLIHDAARPCIDVETIETCIAHVTSGVCCVAGVPVSDTVQIADDEGRIIETPERAKTWIAQTPQCFPLDVALNAYSAAIACKDGSVTDDAMVVRKYAGQPVYLLRGKKENIKLTTETDRFFIENTLADLSS